MKKILITAPLRGISSCSERLRAGKKVSRSVPSTATVLALCRNAALCASLSSPSARPLTSTAPPSARPSQICRVASSP